MLFGLIREHCGVIIGIVPASSFQKSCFMPDWIAKARMKASRQVPAEPVPFQRACLCGELLSGDREDLAQEIFCPSCGRNWFVLPRDVYPWPKVRKPKRSTRVKASLTGWSRRPRGTRENASPEATPAGTATATREKSSSGEQQSSEDSQPEAQLASGATTLEIAPSWRQRVRSKFKRAARPIRLVGGGIAMLIFLTGVWLWYQDRLSDAAETLGKAVPAAEAAIDAGDLPTAAQAMGRAARAVDILGENDKEARRIRQRHRELDAILGLASVTPFVLAAQAALANDSPSRWSSGFAASYAGEWVILDVPLGQSQSATPRLSSLESQSQGDEAARSNEETSGDEAKGAAGEKVIPLLLPLKAGDVPIRFELESSVFEESELRDRAIIALQYKSWTMGEDPGGRPVWVVRFEPGTAFLWASIDLYEAAGFNPHAPVLPSAAQLAEQARILKLAEEAKAAESR